MHSKLQHPELPGALAHRGLDSGQAATAARPAAIILSTESIFAFLSGWLILGEPATPLMLTGCALLFAATRCKPIKKRRCKPQRSAAADLCNLS